MVCNRCECERDNIVFILTDGIGQRVLCPNCAAVAFQNNELSFINNPNLVDDISGKPGAVEFVSDGERYVLERRSMMRLISHNLKQSEWKILAAKYGPNGFMLHDDFYSEDGTALQPMMQYYHIQQKTSCNTKPQSKDWGFSDSNNIFKVVLTILIM